MKKRVTIRCECGQMFSTMREFGQHVKGERHVKLKEGGHYRSRKWKPEHQAMLKARVKADLDRLAKWNKGEALQAASVQVIAPAGERSVNGDA